MASKMLLTRASRPKHLMMICTTILEEKKMLRGTMSGCVPEFPCAKRAVGKMYVIKEKRNSDDGSLKFICVAGPCWPMVLVTFCLIVGVSAGPSISSERIGLIWVDNCRRNLGFYQCHGVLFTACSDPGILPRHNVQPSAGLGLE